MSAEETKPPIGPYLLKLLVIDVTEGEYVDFEGVIWNVIGQLRDISVSPNITDYIRRSAGSEARGKSEVDVKVSNITAGSGYM